MKYLNSNVIAYAFYDNPQKIRCQEIISSGGITSTIALIESFNIIQNEVNRRYAAFMIKSLLRSNIILINIDTNTIFESIKRCEKYSRLKFIDLVHYVTALLNNCSEIASFDKDFDGLEIKRIT